MTFRYPPALVNYQTPSAAYFNTYLRDNLLALKTRADAKAYIVAQNGATQNQSPLRFPTILAQQAIGIDTNNTRFLLPPGMYLACLRVALPWAAGATYEVQFTTSSGPQAGVMRTMSSGTTGSSITLNCMSVLDVVTTATIPITTTIRAVGGGSLQTVVSGLPTRIAIVRIGNFG